MSRQPMRQSRLRPQGPYWYYSNTFKGREENLLPALETDYISDLGVSREVSLLDLCMDRLLSDVSFLKRLKDRTPAPLKLKLLTRAIETCRVCSIEFLLSRYPLEEFVFPIPDSMKNCALLVQSELGKKYLPGAVEKMMEALVVTLCAFKTVISETKSKSNWHILDLGDMPHDFSAVSVIVEPLKRLNKNSCKHYVLKGSFIFSSGQDFVSFIEFRNETNIKLVINGIHSEHVRDIELLFEVLYGIKSEDLNYLSVSFVGERLQLLLPAIRRFKNLTTLLLPYSVERVREDTLDYFSQLLYELPNLRNFSIKGVYFKNQLLELLTKNCKLACVTTEKEYKKLKSSECDLGCCVLHRGTLRYLNVSGCRLTDRDLECLKEEPFCKNIKHLSIGSNQILSMERIVDCLKSMTANLVILDMYGAFEKPISNLQPFFNVLEKFEVLKYIVLGPMNFSSEEQFRNFGQALLNPESLKEVKEIQVGHTLQVIGKHPIITPNNSLDAISHLEKCLFLQKGALLNLKN